jgi:glycosyltransferase involved in cell wall biosynthesis
MADKILFIKWGSFSLINDSIYKILESEFPDMNIDVIDVNDLWKNKIKPAHYIKNMPHFLAEYGGDFLSGYKKRSNKNLYSWFRRTSYFGLLINKFIKDAAAGKKYKFTFQTQSMFNAKIAGIPHFIYTDHTTKANLLYPGINPREYIRSDRFIKKVEQAIYEDATVTFTCGSMITNSLINQYGIPKEKALTVYAGSNVPNWFVENDAKYASKNILFVGVDWERKGGPVLLKAFEKVLQKHSDATLTIVGCNPDKITLPNCKVVGKIKADQVAEYYNKAAIFCLPTLREPFGIVFIEAMHYKLPIVANNIGSIPDMVINDYNGYLIDNIVDDYANALCSLLGNPRKCKQLGENGYDYAQSKFKWNIVGKTIKTEIVSHLFTLHTKDRIGQV